MKNAAGYAPRSAAHTLGDDVAFSLYSTSLAMTKRYKPLLDPLGLTYPQYFAMLTLWANDEVTVKSIAAGLSVDSATVTPMLKRLESQGYITRIRGTSDERLVFIRLTDRGRALYRDAASVPAAAHRATGQSRQFLTQLKDALDELRANL